MVNARTIWWGVWLCLFSASAFGQRLVPLSDRVDDPLTPPGISEMPVEMNAELAYLFRDDGGTNVAHMLGDFILTVGGADGHRLRSREAVVWITDREFDGRAYRHLQVFLWQNGEVEEIGGTFTAAPALFVTVNTFGAVVSNADQVALQASADAGVYHQASAVRAAIDDNRLRGFAAEGAGLRVFDASGLGAREQVPAPKPVMLFRTEGEVTGPMKHGGHTVLTVTGGAYLSRGTPGSAAFMEVRADAVLVFLEPSAEEVEATGPAGLGAESAPAPEGEPAGPPPARRRSGRQSDQRQLMATGFGDLQVEAVYLEGDIIMSQGASRIHASRIYYDFAEERAVMLDAVFSAMLIGRNVPLYMRADEIRQISARRFAADNAALTTSEFHTPHYHVGAEHVDLTNLTPGTSGDGPPGIRAGAFRIRHATLNLGGTPVAYWPFVRGNVDSSETTIKSVRTGYSDDFGVELETKWHLFNALGLQTPEGFDAVFNLDFFSKRGPGVGIDADYEREKYFGEARSYLLFDSDEDFLGEDRVEPSPKDIRGRMLWRHRQFFENDWQLSLELSYISDAGFLEEFFESEYDNEKEQETLFHLKKQRDNWAFTAILQARLMDFVTTTERVPDFAYFRVGEPLAAGATWFSENRLGMVRYRPKDQTFAEFLRDGRADGSGSVGRADTRQEAGIPFDLGPIRMVPFVTGRATAWDDSPHDGGLGRGFATIGVRGSMYLSREYPDIRSAFFDIDGVRHVVKPDLVAWLSESNHTPEDLYPFDDLVESIHDADGVMLGLRQRWQTRRGEGKLRRTVDVVTVDTEIAFFNDVDGDAITNGYTSFSRPENSIAHNYINNSIIWRINDRTALLGEYNYDINDKEMDVLNVSLAVERSPRFSYLLGYRFIEESNSNLFGFDMNYRLSEKHTIAFRERFDLDEGRTLDFTVALIRKMPRWFAALAFELDEAEDDFGISLSLWPEGLPQAALGSRRFTGLSNTTRFGRD